MRRLLSILANLVYIANCAAASTAAVIFLNWYDTGQVDTRGWGFMVMAGLFSGSVSWALEQLLYRRFGIWPRNRLLFFFRIVAASIFFVALGFTIGYATVMLVTSGLGAIVLIPFMPVMTLFYLPMMLPLGILIGTANAFLIVPAFADPHADSPG